jgi:hypothetical protein
MTKRTNEISCGLGETKRTNESSFGFGETEDGIQIHLDSSASVSADDCHVSERHVLYMTVRIVNHATVGAARAVHVVDADVACD